LKFPFQAKCVAERRISPLSEGDEVKVVGMAPEDECMREVFVEIEWLDKVLALPLAQIEAIGIDHATQEGIEDWHYWVAMGYQY
jgi:hypothetical protein